MKRLLFTTKKGPNFVFHLAALGSAGFTSDYTEAYRDSVLPGDLETLERHGGRISFGFGSGHGGDLAGLLIFEPAYLDLETTQALEEYFSLLDEGFRTGDYSRFLGRYKDAHRELLDWTLQVDEKWLSLLGPSRQVVRELGDVYVRSFDRYDTEVYPVEATKMAPTALRLREHFDKEDIIRKWEEVTGYAFKYPTYEIVLCSALKDGPTANSLGYQKNTFYYGHDFEWMKDFISHEVGTHILIDVMKQESASGRHDNYLLYRAYEDLARFYNFKVLGRNKLYNIGPGYHCDQFQAIYSDISSREAGIAPGRLLREGLDLFRARYPDLK